MYITISLFLNNRFDGEQKTSFDKNIYTLDTDFLLLISAAVAVDVAVMETSSVGVLVVSIIQHQLWTLGALKTAIIPVLLMW